VDDCLGAAIGGRQAASKADTALFLSFLGGTKCSICVYKWSRDPTPTCFGLVLSVSVRAPDI